MKTRQPRDHQDSNTRPAQPAEFVLTPESETVREIIKADSPAVEKPARRDYWDFKRAFFAQCKTNIFKEDSSISLATLAKRTTNIESVIESILDKLSKRESITARGEADEGSESIFENDELREHLRKRSIEKRIEDAVFRTLKELIDQNDLPRQHETELNITIGGKPLDPNGCQEIVDEVKAEEKRQSECKHIYSAEGLLLDRTNGRFMYGHSSSHVKYLFAFCPSCGIDLTGITGGGA